MGLLYPPDSCNAINSDNSRIAYELILKLALILRPEWAGADNESKRILRRLAFFVVYLN